MPNSDGVHWQCLNRDCRRSLVSTAATDENETLRCICGSPMSKKEVTSRFPYLDFLREGIVTQEEAGIERE
jgi:hypothetical protein